MLRMNDVSILEWMMLVQNIINEPSIYYIYEMLSQVTSKKIKGKITKMVLMVGRKLEF